MSPVAVPIRRTAGDGSGFHRCHPGRREGIGPDTASAWAGAGLVAFGVLMTAVTGIRFRRYAAACRRAHPVPGHHRPFMAPAFALLITLFGIVLLVLLLVAA